MSARDLAASFFSATFNIRAIFELVSELHWFFLIDPDLLKQIMFGRRLKYFVQWFKCCNNIRLIQECPKSFKLCDQEAGCDIAPRNLPDKSCKCCRGQSRAIMSFTVVSNSAKMSALHRTAHAFRLFKV